MISDAVIGFGNDGKGIDTIRDGAELYRREKSEERRKRYECSELELRREVEP